MSGRPKSGTKLECDQVRVTCWNEQRVNETQMPAFGGVRECQRKSKASRYWAPIGHPEYVRRFLIGLTDEHQTLLNRIPLVGDVQATWLLLVHCAAARATYSLRCADPEAVEGFARRHDQDMMECLSSILAHQPRRLG